jgi:hypothetical protein
MITLDEVRRLLDYDPETGRLTWKARESAVWDSRYAGTAAGSVGRDGYVRVKVNNSTYLAHRLAFLLKIGKWPEDQIDHINRNPSDNRWENLRCATASQNMWNKGAHRNSTSPHVGVCWHGSAKRWVAQICTYGKIRHIGSFTTEDEAAAAYLAAKQVEHAL